MNISQRLRTCARHTGLDAVIELLNEAADEIDALHARANGQATQPAEVTDEQIDSFLRDLNSIASDYDVYEYGLPNHCLIEDNDEGTGEKMREAVRAILALRPQQSGLTGCNCRWDGDTQVQWCELHLAHKEAIHEWAERAKEAEKQLALRPAAVPMTDAQWLEYLLKHANNTTLSVAASVGQSLQTRGRWVLLQPANNLRKLVERAYGITAHAKKETP